MHVMKLFDMYAKYILWHHEGTCGRGALCSSPGMATTPQDGCRENYISQNALLWQVQMPQPSDWSGSSGVGEGENKGAETHTKREASYVAQTEFGVWWTLSLRPQPGGIKLGATFWSLCFAFEVLYYFASWNTFCWLINRILRWKALLPALSCCLRTALHLAQW